MARCSTFIQVLGVSLLLLSQSSLSFAEEIACGHNDYHQTEIRQFDLGDIGYFPSSTKQQLVLAITYDSAAANRVGGEEALLEQITDAIVGANELLDRSNILVELTLGYAVLSDEQNCDQCVTLNKAHRPDGFVTISETGLGYADIPTSVSQAYRGARMTFGVLNFKKNTLAHETGHALGLYHGPRTVIDTTQLGTEPFGTLPAYGMGVVGRDSFGSEFHTIMSYGNESLTSVASGLFSSPHLSHNGVPTGTNEANAVKAANFWAQYVTAAGERNFPLPISLHVTRDGINTRLSGKCLDGVAGSPSSGASISLFHRSKSGEEQSLGNATCDEFGFFSHTVPRELDGTFKATHLGVNSDTTWQSPTWVNLSLHGTLLESSTKFFGVCFAADGLTPNAGKTIQVLRVDDNYTLVGESDCDAEGRYQLQLSQTLPGLFEAQIIGEAYSEQLRLTRGKGDEAGESKDTDSPSPKCQKKKKVLKKKIKTAPKKRKKKLRRKLKRLKSQC